MINVSIFLQWLPKKERPERMKLPEHIERRETIIEPTEDTSVRVVEVRGIFNL
jgi:hypothetical protein